MLVAEVQSPGPCAGSVAVRAVTPGRGALTASHPAKRGLASSSPPLACQVCPKFPRLVTFDPHPGCMATNYPACNWKAVAERVGRGCCICYNVSGLLFVFVFWFCCDFILTYPVGLSGWQRCSKPFKLHSVLSRWIILCAAQHRRA